MRLEESPVLWLFFAPISGLEIAGQTPILVHGGHEKGFVAWRR
jgi:hypothetical protein